MLFFTDLRCKLNLDLFAIFNANVKIQCISILQMYQFSLDTFLITFVFDISLIYMGKNAFLDKEHELGACVFLETSLLVSD